MLKLHSTCSEEKFNFFFSEFSWTLPGFWATVFEKECQNRIFCYQWHLLQKKTKSSILRLLTGFREQYFGSVDKTTFSFCPGALFGKKIFFAENLHYEDSNVFIEKITNFEKKNPTVLTKLLLMSTAKQCGKKIIFLKKTVRSRICYQLRAGILRQFSRGCFLHIQGYTSGRKCRPKKKTINFVSEI